LEEERCFERCVFDAGVRLDSHDWFGPIGDAKTGGFDHVEIVGAISDGERFTCAYT
jgi:hypothetical protein